VQFIIAPDIVWRLRTYATDHDVHAYCLPRSDQSNQGEAEFCIDHIAQHYRNVLGEMHVIEFNRPDFAAEGNEILRERGIAGYLQQVPDGPGLGFYTPDQDSYHTQSQP
jgi:hypothetical protein